MRLPLHLLEVIVDASSCTLHTFQRNYEGGERRIGQLSSQPLRPVCCPTISLPGSAYPPVGSAGVPADCCSSGSHCSLPEQSRRLHTLLASTVGNTTCWNEFLMCMQWHHKTMLYSTSLVPRLLSRVRVQA